MILPNPAHDYFIVSYTVPQVIKEAYLLINSVNGQFVQRIELNRPQDEFVVNTENVKTGSYVVSLIVNGRSLETAKVIIIK
ncbi:MAG: T9SS type A sorting domain-containing protein [Bacteroidetes bacterium]|nr:T9SS type A sorting domain-containing protein [Bacteroidota bacterium]